MNTIDSSFNSQEQRAITCSNCQSISFFIDAFRDTVKGKLCPRCFRKAELESSTKTFKFALWAIVISVVLAVVLYLFGSSWRFLFVNVIVSAPLWYITISLYALVQAGAALIVGGKVFTLQLGSGPTLFKKNVRGCQFSLGKFPVGSSYCVAFPTRHLIQLRRAIFYISGILVHGLIVLFLLPSFDSSNFLSAYAFREIFLLTNAYMLYTIIIPGQLSLSGQVVNNNAVALQRLITRKTDIDTAHSSYYIFECGNAFRRKNYEQVCHICDEGLELYPQNVILKNFKSMAMDKLGQQNEALKLLEDVISSPNLPLSQRALSLNNAGWIILLNKGNLNKAYDYAQEAFSIMPWEPSFQGTWGSALIETGNIEQGIHHVLQAHEHHPSHPNKATNIAYAAIGYHRLGDKHRAKECLDKAILIDIDAEIVKDAQRELNLGSVSKS